MNHRKISKAFLFFCIALTMLFAANLKSLASDYQYKVLDPKYNPYAQDLIEGKLSTPTDEYVPVSDSKKFNFSAFLAAIALVVFPFGVFTFAVKTLKNVSNLSETETQTMGNIKIGKKEEDEEENPSIENSDERLTVQEELSANGKVEQIPEVAHISKKEKTVSAKKAEAVPEPKMPTAPKKEDTECVKEVVTEKKAENPINESLKKYFTSPISKIPNPMLLNTSPLTRNKGLCVVEYNKKYSLIGYINNDIFLLDQFESLKNYEIRSRLTESKNSKDRYIVRLGEYKALVEVSEANMSLLLEL